MDPRRRTDNAGSAFIGIQNIPSGNIGTTAADALASGTWTLEDVGTLGGAFGSSFSVVGFTEAGGDKWTRTNGPSRL